MDYEDVLNDIGDCGMYQLILFSILALTSLQSVVDIETVIFMNYEPAYNCTDARFLNATNVTYIADSKCTADVTYSNGPKQRITCQNFSFDQSVFKRSLVTEFDLVCDRAYLKDLTTMLYLLGIAFGMICGMSGDRLGRRKLILICAVWEIIISIITPIMPYLEGIIVLRFMRGLCYSIFYQGHALICELVPMRRRALYGNNYWLFWCIGYMATPGIAYATMDWRLMKFVCCIPLVVYLSFFFLVPESPRWLALQGKREEAIAMFKKIAKMNGKTLPDEYFKNFVPPKSETGRFSEALYSPTMRLRMFIFCMVQSCVALTYFGLAISESFASSNIFINVFLLGLVEGPTGPSAWIISNKFGRRTPTSVMMVGAGVCVILVPFGHFLWLQTTFAILGKYLVTTAYCVADVLITELFPTSIRNIGLFTTTTTAAFFTIVAPYINNLSNFAFYLSNLVYAIMCITSAVLIFVFIPETKDCPLAETVQEAEGLIRGHEKEWARQISDKYKQEEMQPLENENNNNL